MMLITKPDAAISAAWDRRNAAVADLVAFPQPARCEGLHAPGEEEIYSRLDEAETEIAACNASTPRGAMIQLWSGLYHSLTDYDQQKMLERGDLDGLLHPDTKLDYDKRLMVAALRSLVALSAAQPEALGSIPHPTQDPTPYVLPPMPAGASLDLLPMVDDYLSAFVTDNNADEWGEAAEAIADFRPKSHADLAVKLLIATHYLYPVIADGKPAIDLEAFDVDAGRKILRCVADLLDMGNGEATQC